MTRLAIVGAGDLGRLIAHHVAAAGDTVVGFFDDVAPAGTPVDGSVVLGPTASVESAFAAGRFDALLPAIGYRHFGVRRALFERLSAAVPFAVFVHRSAYVDASAELGPGTVVLPGCVLDRNVRIGRGVLLNTAVTIAHDSSVGDHSFLSPRVAVAGFVAIGECCNIGINTTVIDNVSIGDGVQTGGGAVVTRDLATPGLYVGVPAVLKRAF